MRKAVLLVAVVLVLLAPAAAQAAPGTDPGVASYEGRRIDLSRGWQGAGACAVLSTDDVRCYDTEKEMNDALAAEEQPSSAAAVEGASAAAAYCAGRSDLWLTLYEHASFGGRAVSFRDPGYWQNLSTWGFDKAMTSWRNNTYCLAYAAEGAGGGGAWLNLPARSSSANVGTAWNDRASSVYLTA